MTRTAAPRIDPRKPLWGLEDLAEVERLLLTQLLTGGLEPVTYGPWRECAIFPTKQRLTSTPEGIYAEMMGLPTAGKTTAGALLAATYGFPFLVRDEFVYRGDELFNGSGLEHVLLGQLSVIAQSIKILSCLEWFDYRYWFLQMQAECEDADKPPPIHILGYRGPNDGLSMERYMIGLDDSHHYPGLVKESREASLKMLLTAMYLTTVPSVIILHGISFKTAVQRRVAQGKKPYGRIVNPKIWPLISRGYAWWYSYVWPFLRTNFGTGLLVVNGEKSVGHNYWRIYDYLTKVVDRFDTIHSV